MTDSRSSTRAPEHEAVGPTQPWRPLDWRMLLIHPIELAVKMLPAIVALVVARSSWTHAQPWELYALPVLAVLGFVRWLTTHYRLAADKVELRRGVLKRQLTTVQLSHVRTVTLTAQLHHRLLGLTRVEVSTGAGPGKRLVLDSLRTSEAQSLRAELLRRATAACGSSASEERHRSDGMALSTTDVAGGERVAAVADVDATSVTDEVHVLVRLDQSWLRYAPVTLTGLATAVTAAAFVLHTVSRLPDHEDTVSESVQWLRGLPLWAGAPVVLLAFVALATGAYVMNFWRFHLARSAEGALHVRHGLFTRRETSLNPDRVRGIQLEQPWPLRLVGGARLRALSTNGVRGKGRLDWLVPPAPAGIATAVACEVTADPHALSMLLQRHGGAAARRCLGRAALRGAGVLGALVVVLAKEMSSPALWMCAVVLAAGVATGVGFEGYRALGHGVTSTHLVIRQGVLRRRLVVLERAAVIGWVVKQSSSQRRAGLVTLVATTAAGAGRYEISDLPESGAGALLERVTPGLARQFR